jgi:endonuclease/exonuclease/phosphatase family metal-dependent hydrolase
VRLRIATYNIRRGGWPRRHALARVLGAIDPDVAVLQEATDPDVVRMLADATGSEVVLHTTANSVAILTRRAWREARWHAIAPRRFAAEVDLACGVRILGVHLSAGLSSRGERRRALELERLLAVAGEGPAGGTIIAGDLNAIAPGDNPAVSDLPRWIRILLRFDGGIATTVVERVLDAGFVDAYRQHNPGDPGTTMPAIAPSVRLDYLMLGPALATAVEWCRVGVAEPADLVIASDHLPVVAELELPGDPAAP